MEAITPTPRPITMGYGTPSKRSFPAGRSDPCSPALSPSHGIDGGGHALSSSPLCAQPAVAIGHADEHVRQRLWRLARPVVVGRTPGPFTGHVDDRHRLLGRRSPRRRDISRHDDDIPQEKQAAARGAGRPSRLLSAHSVGLLCTPATEKRGRGAKPQRLSAAEWIASIVEASRHDDDAPDRSLQEGTEVPGASAHRATPGRSWVTAAAHRTGVETAGSPCEATHVPSRNTAIRNTSYGFAAFRGRLPADPSRLPGRCGDLTRTGRAGRSLPQSPHGQGAMTVRR